MSHLARGVIKHLADRSARVGEVHEDSSQEHAPALREALSEAQGRAREHGLTSPLSARLFPTKGLLSSLWYIITQWHDSHKMTVGDNRCY